MNLTKQINAVLGWAKQNGLYVPDLQVITGCHYRAWCYRNGVLVWEDGFDNLVVTLGRNLLLDNSFDDAAAAFLWYVGLKDTGTVAAGDTMASHAGWAELTIYDEANRQAWTKNGVASAGAMSNSASKAVFTISAADDIYGAFMADNNTKGGSTGVLFGAGDFASPRSVIDNDVLNVQVDISITSS